MTMTTYYFPDSWALWRRSYYVESRHPGRWWRWGPGFNISIVWDSTSA